MNNTSLPSIYWLWIPVVFMVVQITLEVFMDNAFLSALLSENGPHELLHAVVMVASFFVALSYFFLKGTKTLILKLWFGLAAVCSFYVAGEELSWGQQIWNWTTPEFWSDVNDQNETNLHNISSWFDQKPRLILEIGIVVGTIIIPALKKFNLLKISSYLDILLPSKQLIVIALLVFVPHVFEKFFDIFDIIIFERFSEVQELYMFYFVLLYLIILKSTSQKIKND